MASVEGSADLLKELDRLEKKTGPKIAKRTVSSAGSALAAGVRRSVPKTMNPGHSPRRLKKAIGFRSNKKDRKNLATAKVGFVKPKYAPHAHLYILGTKKRTRRRIGGEFRRFDRRGNRGTGSVKGQRQVVPHGVASSINKARRNMKRTAERELVKHRRRRRRRR